MSDPERITERIAALNRRGEWVARNNGTGKLNWFPFNERTREYHYSSHGNMIWYSLAGAVRTAERLNNELIGEPEEEGA